MISPSQPSKSKEDVELKPLAGREASLYVKGVASIPEFALKKHFSKYGDVHVSKKTDDYLGLPMDYTFLDFVSVSAAKAAFDDGLPWKGETDTRRHCIGDQFVIVRLRQTDKEEKREKENEDKQVRIYFGIALVILHI